MKKYILGKYLILLFIMGVIPCITSASSIYFETSKDSAYVGDTFIISAKINSEKTQINTVEGDIVLKSESNNLIVNDFSLAKSIFSLWPKTPSLSTDGNTVSFIGGVPGGFNINNATLFNIIVQAEKEGDIIISADNIFVYANDGKGTRVPVTSSNLNIKVLPKDNGNISSNEWVDLVAGDKINPENFEIIIGEDSSVFEGKRFAFFMAIDNQSGISYYEVSENGKPAVRSGSMYVLANQDKNTTPVLTVTAFDKAGNKTISIYNKPGATILGFSVSFVIIVILILIIWIILRRIKKIRLSRKNV